MLQGGVTHRFDREGEKSCQEEDLRKLTEKKKKEEEEKINERPSYRQTEKVKTGFPSGKGERYRGSTR